MSVKYAADCPAMTWVKDDLTESQFSTAAFSCVLDKGTLDAIFTDGSRPVVDRVELYLGVRGVDRVELYLGVTVCQPNLTSVAGGGPSAACGRQVPVRIFAAGTHPATPATVGVAARLDGASLQVGSQQGQLHSTGSGALCRVRCTLQGQLHSTVSGALETL